MQRVTDITVHYSATYPDQDITAADVDDWHRARGFRMIGYHFFLRRNAMREQGRPLTMIGAHVANHNSGNIGICWAGGLDRATGPNVGVNNMTQAQERELIALIKELLELFPGARVKGHNDFANTQCPGFDVGAWWAKVSNADFIPPAQRIAPDAPVRTPGVTEDGTHVVEAGETWFSIAMEHGLAPADLAAVNDAHVTDILQIGRRLKISDSAPVKVIEHQTVPDAVEKDVRKQTNRFGWLTMLSGALGSGAAGIAGMDWRTVAAIGVISLAGLAAIAILGPVLARSVRRIKREIEE